MDKVKTLSGIILLDKPAGPTSHDMVYKARKKTGVSTIGHSGTLDPAATGLLILLVGREATKRQIEFLRMDKLYSGTIIFGIETDTWDMQGRVLSKTENFDIDIKKLNDSISALSGEITQQIPPYSAAKKGGIPLYKMARRNMPVPFIEKKVRVNWLKTSLKDSELSFVVQCSSGTYIRSLAAKLGDMLSVKAALKSLRREKIGPYSVEKAFKLEDFEKASLTELILPI